MPHKRTILLKPFCYFCGRECHSEATLIQHQLRRHFRCPRCNKEMQTLAKLQHHYQEHGMLERVPHACRERSRLEPVAMSIIGMESVPYQALIDRRDEIQRRVGERHKVVIPQELFQLTARIGSGTRSLSLSYARQEPATYAGPNEQRPRQQFGRWRQPESGAARPPQRDGDRWERRGLHRPEPRPRYAPEPPRSMW